MPHNPHQARNRPRMARQTHHARLPPLALENLVQKPQRPHIMLRERLPMIRPPQLILLREPLLNRPSRIRLVNNSPAAPPIARVLAHHLPRQLLDRRPEALEPQLRPLQLSRAQAAHQRARDPGVWNGHLLLRKLRFEELARVARLPLADGRQARVVPEQGPVARQLAPVVVPGFGPVEGFGDVVLALAVAGEVEELVGCVWGRGGGQLGEVGGEELPLGLWRGEGRWGGVVGARDEAEVVFCLRGGVSFV